MYKKSVKVVGTYKDIVLAGGNFYDDESGEMINVVKQIESMMKGVPFTLTITQKSEVELDDTLEEK